MYSLHLSYALLTLAFGKKRCTDDISVRGIQVIRYTLNDGLIHCDMGRVYRTVKSLKSVLRQSSAAYVLNQGHEYWMGPQNDTTGV